MPELSRLFVFLIFAMVIVLVITAKQNRRQAALTERKQCRQCGARYGSEALYCGRCGRAF